MNEENFKIIISCYDKTITINRDHPDITIFEAVEDIVTCLLGLTFNKETIIEGFSKYIEKNEVS